MAQNVSKRFLLTSLVVAAALLVPIVALTGRQSEGGRVRGRVVDRESGLGVSAELGLVIRDGRGVTVKHVRTSDTGEFEVTDLPDGHAHLTTKCEGYAAEHEGVSLNSGETQTVDFRLVKAKTVRGTIVDADGEALEGAQVRVIYADATGAPDAVAASYQWELGDTKSDARGAFEIETHPEREFVIEASRAGYVGEVSGVQYLRQSDTPSHVRMSLRPGVRVIGETRSADGELISGAHVSLTDEEDRPDLRRFTSAERLRQHSMQTLSGPDGHFEFDQVSPARKELVVAHPRFQSTRQTLYVTNERDSEPARVTLQRRVR